MSLSGRLIILVASAVTVLGFCGSSQWQLLFLDQPRPHYCLMVCVGLSLVALGSRTPSKKQWVISGFIFLLVNTYLVFPSIFPYAKLLPNPQIYNTEKISIAHLTLDHKLTNFDRISQYLETENPDIVSILEVPLDKLIEIEKRLTSFRLVSPNISLNLTSAASSAWFVSEAAQKRGLKVRDSKLISIPQNSPIPMMELDVFFEPFNEEIKLLSFQTRRPTSAVRVALFQREFSGLIDWYQSQAISNVESIIVAGDFNTAPWSSPFRKLLRLTDMRNTNQGYGMQSTWNSHSPIFLRMPIDHILCSRKFKVAYRKVGGDVGSDHLPVVATLRQA